MMTWQASHDSYNTRDKDLAVGKAYGMCSNGLIDTKNGIQFIGQIEKI